MARRRRKLGITGWQGVAFVLSCNWLSLPYNRHEVREAMELKQKIKHDVAWLNFVANVP